jgi:hypothetical protein
LIYAAAQQRRRLEISQAVPWLGPKAKGKVSRRPPGHWLQAHAYSFMFRPLLMIAAGDFDRRPKAFDGPQAVARQLNSE